jgi:hypothetical protein
VALHYLVYLCPLRPAPPGVELHYLQFHSAQEGMESPSRAACSVSSYFTLTSRLPDGLRCTGPIHRKGVGRGTHSRHPSPVTTRHWANPQEGRLPDQGSTETSTMRALLPPPPEVARGSIQGSCCYTRIDTRTRLEAGAHKATRGDRGYTPRSYNPKSECDAHQGRARVWGRR